MGFKKTKLHKTESGTSLKKIAPVTNVRDQYLATKERNALISVIGTVLASVCIWFLGFILLSSISGVRFDFSLPKFVTHSLPFLKANDEPEKLNILLTWVGGAGHDGSELTDTIILASVNRRTNSVSMLSIPRDLYVEFDGGRRGKVNETYQRALNKSNPEAAMIALEKKVTEITGEPIDKYLNIDFAGFAKFVDILGGIEVDVPESIVDKEYPDDNWGYQTFRISKGFQQLDGATALKYVRSRHSTSDFDRSARQQLIIAAIKDKLLSANALASPSKLQALYAAVTSHIKTDLSLDELFGLALFAKDLPNGHILSFNLNDGCFQSAAFCTTGGFLYTPDRELFGGASVLLPEGAHAGKISEYSTVKWFANLIYNYPELYLEKEEITIVNATRVTGLANKLAMRLKKLGFNIPEKNSISSTKDSIGASSIQFAWDDAAKVGVSPSSPSLRALQIYAPFETTAVPALPYTELVGPRIEIILGDDAVRLLK